MKIFRRLPRTNFSAPMWKLWGESYIAQSIVTLGVPIIVGQIGSIAQQFADTIMVGQYSTLDLAAAGFVNNVFNFVIYFLLGISYASTPVIGAAFGKKDYQGVQRSLIESIIVNFLMSLVVVVLLMLLYWNIGILNQPDEIMPVAMPYFIILTISVPFMAVFNALKQFSDAIGETKIPMWIMLSANALNIILNCWFIFGFQFSVPSFQFSIPAMGLYGAGIATLIARIFSVVALLTAIISVKHYRQLSPVSFMVRWHRTSQRCEQSTNTYHLSSITLTGMRHLLFLGIPISIQLGLEASSFNVTAIFMGWLGTIPLAAHQVMCTISTLCFQVVYGIGAAASVLIAQFRGVGDWHNVRRTSRSAFSIGLTLIIIIIALIYTFRYPLIGCFTNNEEVTACMMTILPCFFIYQFGDCMQITFANALRGIEEVKRMMLYAFIAYICVSIPLSYIFAFLCHLGTTGVWMGMPFGLTTAGILFFSEFRRKTKN